MSKIMINIPFACVQKKDSKLDGALIYCLNAPIEPTLIYGCSIIMTITAGQVLAISKLAIRQFHFKAYVLWSTF